MEELKTEDWSEYLELRSQLTGFPLNLTREEFIKKYQEIRRQNSYIFVYKVRNKILATGKLLIETKFGDNVAHIEDVVVNKDHRRKGYGTKVVQHLIKLAESMGCYKVILVTREHNEAFYRASDLQKSGICMNRILM